MKGRAATHMPWVYIQIFDGPNLTLIDEKVASALHELLYKAGIEHVWGGVDPACLGCGSEHS